MEKYYSEAERLLVAIDCIIFGFEENRLKLLIVKRKVEPELEKWSLVGGFVKKEESLNDAAQRIVHNLTGLNNIYLEQIGAYGEVGRDPEARVISVPYFALIRVEDYKYESGEKYEAHWVSLKMLPKLIFDHTEMVRAALAKLQETSMIKFIGYRLLPKQFSLPQLQSLYEAIHLKKFDKRNYRKWVSSLGVLKKLNIKDKSTSRKGAFLYEFKKVKNKRK